MLKNALKLGTLLTKSEAKKIVAGRGCDPGYVMCPDGGCIPMGEECGGGGFNSGTCCAHGPTGSLFCWISKNEAIHMAGCEDLVNGTDCLGHWCCDSCATASWTSNCYK